MVVMVRVVPQFSFRDEKANKNNQRTKKIEEVDFLSKERHSDKYGHNRLNIDKNHKLT